MTAKTRSTINTQRHLSTDFEWEGLASPPSPPLDPATEFTERKKTSAGKSASKTKTSPLPSSDSPAVTGPPILPSASIDGATAATSQGELAKLQLLKETQQLEIKKLELQLQLAQLQGNQPISLPSGDLSSSGKSLGNLKAPQKTLHP